MESCLHFTQNQVTLPGLELHDRFADVFLSAMDQCDGAWFLSTRHDSAKQTDYSSLSTLWILVSACIRSISVFNPRGQGNGGLVECVRRVPFVVSLVKDMDGPQESLSRPIMHFALGLETYT